MFPNPWPADFIVAPQDIDGAPIFGTDFTVADNHGAIRSAVLWLTAHGVAEGFIDGRPITTELLAPGWNSYEWRQPVVRYDVTPQIHVGVSHHLSFLVGAGWYASRLGWLSSDAAYGSQRAVAVVLRVTCADGHVQQLCTTEDWIATRSTIVSDSLYDGQRFDLRRKPGVPLPVGLLDNSGTEQRPVLFEHQGPPIIRQETLSVQAIMTTPSGATVLDFGQNLVGWVRFHATGPAGHRVRVRHSEVLEHGEIATRPLRSALATDEVILSGEPELIEPKFTLHGFRYVEVTGWPDPVRPEDFEAVVVGSQLRRIGSFACSDDRLNQLHHNTVWSTKGNFVGVPTDCPQRDERLGWTGDLAVFAPTAAQIFDIEKFTLNWLDDVRAEQVAAGGRVPYVVPDVLKGWSPRQGEDPRPTAIWSDAAVWVPWALWQAYGNRQTLSHCYPMMRDHVERVADRLSDRDLWEGDFQFGDWLDPNAPPDDPFAAVADVDVVATMAFYRSLSMTAQAALELGETTDATRFDALATRIKGAFLAHWVDEGGKIHSDCPTVYTLAITTGLVEGELLERAGKRLAALVAKNDYRIATGFAGTPYILEALTKTGHLTTSYRLLLQEECPSWLYPIAMGATTIWERWDSMLPTGEVNPGEMTSFNHYALGSVVEWLYRTVGGVRPTAPGWTKVRVEPQPGGNLTWARTETETPLGLLTVAWQTAPVWSLTVDAPDGMEIEIVQPSK